MRFYTQQHQFYCGIDLHANSMYVCVLSGDGTKHLHANFPTRNTDRFLDAIEPLREHDLIVGCESTFNWYWLADLCAVQNIPFLLATDTRRIARHCQPSINWTLSTRVSRSLLNGPGTSRMISTAVL